MSLMQPWQCLERFVEIRSAWLTLIGEHLQDSQGNILDYWRVEKADSVIILTLKDGNLVFPVPMYRPGLAELTLYCPERQVPPGKPPQSTVFRLFATAVTCLQCRAVLLEWLQSWQNELLV